MSTPDQVTAEFVIDAYDRLLQIEKSFRMSKHDLRARPIYHHKRDSIEAHLTIVLAALAVNRWIEQRRLVHQEVRTHRPATAPSPYGTATTPSPPPTPSHDDLRRALKTLHANSTAH